MDSDSFLFLFEYLLNIIGIIWWSIINCIVTCSINSQIQSSYAIFNLNCSRSHTFCIYTFIYGSTLYKLITHIHAQKERHAHKLQYEKKWRSYHIYINLNIYLGWHIVFKLYIYTPWTDWSIDQTTRHKTCCWEQP